MKLLYLRFESHWMSVTWEWDGRRGLPQRSLELGKYVFLNRDQGGGRYSPQKWGFEGIERGEG